MKILNQSTELTPVKKLRKHPKNPRRGNVETISESIATNGFYGTVIAQKSTGYILAGNHRYEAAKASGAKELPVTWLDVNDEHALRILLADNRANDLAGYDSSALDSVLRELADGIGLDGTGYDASDLDELAASLSNFVPNTNPTTGSAFDTTSEDMEAAAAREENRLHRIEVLKQIVCPHCGGEFGID